VYNCYSSALLTIPSVSLCQRISPTAVMSIQRPISAIANARAQSASSVAAAAFASPSATSSGPFSAKEKSLRKDPTLARSFRGHHGAVLSVTYSPVLMRAIDTGLPGYSTSTELDGENMIGGTASSRARAQRAATSYVQQLASGGADHVVMLWHLRPQLRAFRFLGHSGAVNSVAFSADGTLLASASDDCTVRVWTPSAEGRSVILRGHVKRVTSVVWSSDDRWLLSTSDDQQCKVPPPQLLKKRIVKIRSMCISTHRCSFHSFSCV
jgi:WD40 repeat protein